MTLTDWLESSLEKNSTRDAVRMNGIDLTYFQLSQASANFAAELRKCGVSQGCRVAIHFEKSIEAVVAIFAVLRLGAAYVPIDTHLPLRRKQKLLKLAAPSLIVDGGNPLEESDGIQSLSLMSESLDFTPCYTPLRNKDPDEKTAAYILFTSGSTGEPKAVEISQSAALAFTLWAANFFHLGPTDTIGACAGFHFDLSTFDLFASIGSGSKTVLLRDGVAGFPSELAKFLEIEKISVLYSVPSTLSLLAEFIGDENSKWPNLRLLLCAGDIFPTKAALKIRALSGAKIFNLYGPTETNVCTAWEYDNRDSAKPVPIGLPVAGAKCAIVDENLQPVAIGETGELYVGGPTLMTGYLNDENATKQALLNIPQLGLCYRTGDSAFQDQAGLFYFRGRNDSQIKSCGYRIHPAEIESVLKQHPGVVEAAVIGIPDTRLGKRLVAFLETNGKAEEESVHELLKRELPGYMIPDTIRFLERLPRNANGKIDRGLLAKEIAMHQRDLS